LKTPHIQTTCKTESKTTGLSVKPPCETVVKYMLPVFRSIVAKMLVTEYHFSQVKAAQKMGITQANISQYLSSKRGVKYAEFEQDEVIRSTAQQMAQDIANGKVGSNDSISSMCKMCAAVRSRELLCDIHKILTALPNSCDICRTPVMSRPS
jgi:predicted transcriptional regulator